MDQLSSPDRFVPPAPYPGSKDLGFMKRMRRNAQSQIGMLPDAAYSADAWKPPLPGMPLFVMSPDLVKTVLLDQADAFPHGALFERIMRPAWGEGLLLSRSDEWKMQRRAAASAFRAGNMRALIPTFIEETNKLVADWSAAGYGTIDLHAEMKRLTFNIILETMLSGAQQIDREAFREKVQAFFADISKLRVSYFLRGDAYHAGRRSLRSAHRTELVSYLSDMLAHRQAAPPRGDLVDLLLVAEEPESGARLSDTQLIDNLLGFILAGYETTAAALTWTLYLIAAHEATGARLLDELRSSDTFNTENQPFAELVISEALRLYPPAFMITRIANSATQLGKHRVRKGQRINIPIWAIHRNPDTWSDPHAFNPDRFAPDRATPARYTYMPFGAGPRICIGASFALTEMRCVLAAILSRVKIMAPPRSSVWPKTELALVPHEKMLVEISPR